MVTAFSATICEVCAGLCRIVALVPPTLDIPASALSAYGLTEHSLRVSRLRELHVRIGAVPHAAAPIVVAASLEVCSQQRLVSPHIAYPRPLSRLR